MIRIIYNDLDKDYYGKELSTSTSLIYDINDYFSLRENPFIVIEEMKAEQDSRDKIIKKKVNNFLSKFSPHSSQDMLIHEITDKEFQKAKAFLKVIQEECRRRTMEKSYIGIIWFRK